MAEKKSSSRAEQAVNSAKKKNTASGSASKKVSNRKANAAKKAAEKLKNDPESFTVVKVEPPYEIKSVFRKSEQFPEGKTFYRRHASSFIAAMNSAYTEK